jgi:hypothetical protein
MPIYYSKIPKEEFGEDALVLHIKLKHKNKRLSIILFCFTIYFIAFCIIATKFGT